MITKILVPLDTSELAEQALLTAAAIAKASSAELWLALVHPMAPVAGYPDAPWNAARTSMKGGYVEDKAREIEKQFGVVVVTKLLRGDVTKELVDLAQAQRIDLIVMTTHGRTGLSRSWMGSVADTIMRSVDIPVLMLRECKPGSDYWQKPQTFPRILIPLDGSLRAERIIDAAVAVAGTNASFVLARAVAPIPSVPAYADPYAISTTTVDSGATDSMVTEASDYVGRVAKMLADRGVASVEQATIVADHAGSMLLDVARAHGVNLIALGSHGRGASRFIFGSVADSILSDSMIPILVCRGGAV
ncbi:MAG: universal stress protein [Microbacteriaceae bacterium]